MTPPTDERVKHGPPNTASPPPPNSMELPSGIRPLSLNTSQPTTEARLRALIQFYELGLTPADREMVSALRDLLATRQALREASSALSSAPWCVVKGKENTGRGWLIAHLGCDHNGEDWYIETDGVHASEAVSEPEADAKAIVKWRNALACEKGA